MLTLLIILGVLNIAAGVTDLVLYSVGGKGYYLILGLCCLVTSGLCFFAAGNLT